MVLMVMVVMVNGDGVDGTDDGDVDYHQLDNHQGEHADCRGRSLTLVPATTEGRIIKSLSVLSDDGRDDDFVFSLLIIIKMVVVIATEGRVIKNLFLTCIVYDDNGNQNDQINHGHGHCDNENDHHGEISDQGPFRQ